MQRIGFIVFPGFEVLSLSTATVFEVSNIVAKEELYQLHVISETGGAVRTSIGAAVETEPFGDTAFDTVIVAGTLYVEQELSPKLIAYIRDAREKFRRVASICTGARGSCRGRRARRKARDDTLVLRQQSPDAIPQGESGGRSHVH